MINPNDIQTDIYGTAAPRGQNEGILQLTHVPTKTAVRMEWSERNHDSLLHVREKAMAELTRLVDSEEKGADGDNA